jgi:hypothetical protein
MSIERPFEVQVADLWDAVLNLSLPADEQLLILEASGDREAIDELALSLDDAFWVVAEAYDRNQLTRAEMDALNELNSWLNEMSGQSNAEKWTPDGLTIDEAWEKVRQLARSALAKRQVSRVQKASA